MRWISLPLALLLVAACDGPSGPPDEDDAPNVIVFGGAEMVTTDSAVIVNGVPRVNFGQGPAGVSIYSFTEYTYGGLFEPVNDALVEESWFLDVGRRIVTAVRGDTVFSRALDFGDVALEGTPAQRIEIDTAWVVDTPDGVRVYENLLVLRVPIHIYTVNMDGTAVPFIHEPFYDGMLAGAALELTAGGSDEIAPTSATLTVTVPARVTGLTNGEELDFEHERPLLRNDRPLVVEFSRPLAPDRAVLHLACIPPPGPNLDPEAQRRASAVFALRNLTGRVVIPAAALAEVAAHLPQPEGECIFRIYEYTVAEDVLVIERLKDGITEGLNAVQSNGFGFNVHMTR